MPYDNDKRFAPYKSQLYMHEYGHYLQSQKMGLRYMFVVGIPSFCDLAFGNGDEFTKMHDYYFQNHDLRWFELDASRRGKEYFGIEDDDWNFWRYPIENPANYQPGEYYPNNPFRPKY